MRVLTVLRSSFPLPLLLCDMAVQGQVRDRRRDQVSVKTAPIAEQLETLSNYAHVHHVTTQQTRSQLYEAVQTTSTSFRIFPLCDQIQLSLDISESTEFNLRHGYH